MKPLGLTKKGAWDFIDARDFKNANDRHSNSGDRTARKFLKRLIRSLKRSKETPQQNALKRRCTNEVLNPETKT